MEKKKQRLIFIDLMRALAVLLMVQGHTIHSLLGIEYRTFDSSFFLGWHTIRGFTAPIFMFTAGLAFTYLLRSDNTPFALNPRIKKGFTRVATLLGIGYLLRIPTYNLLNLSDVSYEQWKTFYSVDALHLIGMGLLIVILLSYIGEKLKLTDNVVFSIGALFFILLAPSVLSSDLYMSLPPVLAGYITDVNGSLFPLFPWAGYVVGGALLGSFIANNTEFVKTKVFSYNLMFYGTLSVSVSAILAQLNIQGLITDSYWAVIIRLVALRIGVVVLLYGLATIIEKRITNLPKIVLQLGSKTLLIYVAHLMVLYGFIWFPGLNSIMGESLSAFASISAAIGMISLMFLLVVITSNYKFQKKRVA